MPHGKGGSSIWPATRWALYYRDNFECVHCGVKVTPGVSPASMKSDNPRVKGWAAGVRGWRDDGEVACIDHVRPGCPVAECVTSCWRCNSSAKDRPRDIVAKPLTARHRAMGRLLYKRYCAERDRLRAGGEETEWHPSIETSELSATSTQSTCMACEGSTQFDSQSARGPEMPCAD